MGAGVHGAANEDNKAEPLRAVPEFISTPHYLMFHYILKFPLESLARGVL